MVQKDPVASTTFFIVCHIIIIYIYLQEHITSLLIQPLGVWLSVSHTPSVKVDVIGAKAYTGYAFPTDSFEIETKVDQQVEGLLWMASWPTDHYPMSHSLGCYHSGIAFLWIIEMTLPAAPPLKLCQKQVRIGVNTGEVLSGTFGSDLWLGNTGYGDGDE